MLKSCTTDELVCHMPMESFHYLFKKGMMVEQEYRWSIYLHLHLLCCSIKEGKHTSLLPKVNRLIWADYHYGSQVLFSTHASPVIPKASPLKVILICSSPTLVGYLHEVISLLNWYNAGWVNFELKIEGPFGKFYGLDARHWNPCENGARFGQGQGWVIGIGHRTHNTAEHKSAAHNMEVRDALRDKMTNQNWNV